MKKNILLSLVMFISVTCLMSQQAFAEDEYIQDSWTFDQGKTETNSGVAVDSQGNIYVASTMTTATGDPVVSDNYIIKYDQTGTIHWIRNFPFDGGQLARITAIAVDGSDNVIATGTVQGPIFMDCLTVKYNAGGDLVWSRYYSNNDFWGNDQGLDVAVDSAGTIYVAGKSYVDTTYWNYTGFVIKWSESGFFMGSVVNNKSLSGAGNENRVVTIDGNDNVYVLNYTQVPEQAYNILKYNSELVSLTYPNNIAQTMAISNPVDITADSAGNLILAGRTRRVDIMDGVEKNYHDFIKLNASGEFQCGRQELFANPSGYEDQYDGYEGVTTDAAGNIYLAGTDQTHFITIKFDSNCISAWGEYPVTPDYKLWKDSVWQALGNAIAVDANENIYVTGDTYIKYDRKNSNLPMWNVSTVQYRKIN